MARCTARTANGRCKAHAVIGTRYCIFHGRTRGAKIRAGTRRVSQTAKKTYSKAKKTYRKYRK